MKKGVIFILVTVGILIAAIVYWELRQYAATSTSLFHFVPENAPMILSSNNILQLNQKLKQKKFWKELKEVALINKLDTTLAPFENIFQESLPNTVNYQTLISIHPTGAKSYDFLYITDLTNVEKIKDQKIIKTLIANGHQVTQRKFKQQKVYDIINPKTNVTYTCSLIDGVWIGSTTSFLVDYAIIQFEKSTSLLDDKNFKKN